MTQASLHVDSINEIVDYVHSGTNVNVVGMRSSGRSAVLTEVSEILAREGISLTRIAGLRALRDRPLAALAVAGVQLPASPNHLHTLTSAVSAIEALVAHKPAVLIVDDADDLDDASMGALIAAHVRLRVPVVTTSRLTGRRRPHTRALTAELQPGIRVTLPPLGYEGVHQLVHQLLGAAVDPATVSRIAAQSGGLPGLVRAIVDSGRRSSRLGVRDGRWVARKGLWSTSLAPSVEPLLADLDDTGIDAITMLSFAGTLPMSALMRLADVETIAGLDDAGLIQVMQDAHRPMVGVFPPLIAEYLTHEGSATRTMLAAERLHQADAHITALRPPVTSIQVARSAQPVMNRRIARHWQSEIAERRSKWEIDPTAVSAIDLLEALLVSCARPHEIDSVISDTSTENADPQAVARFAVWTSFHRGLAKADIPGARAIVAQRPEGTEPYDAYLRAADAYLRLLTETAPEIDTLAIPCDQDRLSQDAMTVVRAETLVARGQAHAALDLLNGFTTTVASLKRTADTTRELAMLYTGDVTGAVASALEHVGRARSLLDPAALEAHSYVAGLGLALQGKVVELDDLVGSTLALASSALHQPQYQRGLLALAAAAASWQGRRDYASSLALQADGLGSQPGPHPCMASDHVANAVRSTDDAAVADRLWALALERLEGGYLPAGIIAGVCAVERHPDPERAAALRVAAASCDTALFGHLAAYAVAIASGEPEQLAAMEVRLGAAGLRLYAIRAAVAHSVGLLARGDLVDAARQADTAWSQAGLRGRDLCGLFVNFDRAVNLTTREREVAVLVARGMTAPEIAARMVLSVRTVENHTFSACRKVGVDTRDRLAHAAQTWLSCATH